MRVGTGRYFDRFFNVFAFLNRNRCSSTMKRNSIHTYFLLKPTEESKKYHNSDQDELRSNICIFSRDAPSCIKANVIVIYNHVYLDGSDWCDRALNRGSRYFPI